MTVAFNDVVLLRDLLSGVDDISDWRKVEKVLKRWHWARKPMAATVNILSVALYDLFGAEGLSISPSVQPARLTPSLLQTRISLFYGKDVLNISSVVEIVSLARSHYCLREC